jgi:hypothetical protein
MAMLTSSLLLGTIFIFTQAADSAGADFFTSRFYYTARLIGAILIATLLPLQIDRRARRSSRIGR